MSIPLTSEPKSSYVSHIFPSETEEILLTCETSNLSSYPPFNSSFQSGFCLVELKSVSFLCLGIACVAHASILCSYEFWTHVGYSFI